MPAPIPVLDVGGTHVTAALVEPGTWRVLDEPVRVDVDGQAEADAIIERFAAAGGRLDVRDTATWGVAMPDPFDYARGVGRFHGVAKFESLDGVDVGAALRRRLPGGAFAFCNDADAFTIGEWVHGAGSGYTRVVGLTLGTGVGSGWIDAGRVCDPGVPPGGRAHRLRVDGVPLEDVMSRRALQRAYGAATGRDADVREIAARARAGEHPATEVLAHALCALGVALAGPIRDFGADVVIVGGSMSRSWDLFEPWFRQGADGPLPPVRAAADPDCAPLVGAAYVAGASSSR